MTVQLRTVEVIGDDENRFHGGREKKTNGVILKGNKREIGGSEVDNT